MDIIKLEGEDKRLYDLVAHLVMDEEVLAYNLNYPYKTSFDYVWFVAVTDTGDTLGFMPVKLEENKARINNYYIADDDGLVFSALLKEIVNTLSSDYEIESVAQIQHIPNFEQHGFTVVLYWKRYVKMKVIRKDEEECL
ncbi:MAG: hypothetical protein LBV02_07825 [Bacteroidales bacterium]|jgi:hypothetical protein|nr:hypothetical protein [Bacteroidales bacterium]